MEGGGRIMQNISLDHVGFVTNDLDKFEDFWVKILGFKMIFQSRIPGEMNKALFGFNISAFCARYSKGKMTIEVHVYDKKTENRPMPFNCFGLNHIALWVKDREKFLKKHDFKTHIYHNPKGWDNIFIEDFEGNWIELRTQL